MARYIENGFAKVAPCTCSTSAIFEKADDGLDAVWRCRNCGEHKPRRVSGYKGGGIRVNRDGDIEIRVDGVWRAA